MRGQLLLERGLEGPAPRANLWGLDGVGHRMEALLLISKARVGGNLQAKGWLMVGLRLRGPEDYDLYPYPATTHHLQFWHLARA